MGKTVKNEIKAVFDEILAMPEDEFWAELKTCGNSPLTLALLAIWERKVPCGEVNALDRLHKKIREQRDRIEAEFEWEETLAGLDEALDIIKRERDEYIKNDT
jgi:hypothetical protein